jgi:hypothetical protein
VERVYFSVVSELAIDTSPFSRIRGGIAVENQKKSWTLTTGWIVLFILGLIIALGGLESLYVAYASVDNPVAGVSLSRLAEVHPDIPLMLRARRATAASLAFSLGILLVWIAFVPFRRAEKWAWWALGISFVLGSLLMLLRIPVLGTQSGIGQAIFTLVIVIIALAISYRDFK